MKNEFKSFVDEIIDVCVYIPKNKDIFRDQFYDFFSVLNNARIEYKNAIKDENERYILIVKDFGPIEIDNNRVIEWLKQVAISLNDPNCDKIIFFGSYYDEFAKTKTTLFLFPFFLLIMLFDLNKDYKKMFFLTDYDEMYYLSSSESFNLTDLSTWSKGCSDQQMSKTREFFREHRTCFDKVIYDENYNTFFSCNPIQKKNIDLIAETFSKNLEGNKEDFLGREFIYSFVSSFENKVFNLFKTPLKLNAEQYENNSLCNVDGWESVEQVVCGSTYVKNKHVYSKMNQMYFYKTASSFSTIKHYLNKKDKNE